MIPHLTIRERIIAWMLWHINVKHGFGGGFEHPMDDAHWQFSDPDRASLLYTYGLLRDYYHIKTHRIFGRRKETHDGRD